MVEKCKAKYSGHGCDALLAPDHLGLTRHYQCTVIISACIAKSTIVPAIQHVAYLATCPRLVVCVHL